MEFYQKSTKGQNKKSKKTILRGVYKNSFLILLTICLAFQLTHQTDTVKAKNAVVQNNVNMKNNMNDQSYGTGDKIKEMLVKDENFNFLVDNSTFNVPMTVLSTSLLEGEHLTYSAESEVVTTNLVDKSEENTRHVIMIGASVLGMLAVILFIYVFSQVILTQKRRKKAFKDLEKRLILDTEEDYELLYIDLGKGKILSNKNFALFQINSKRKLFKIRELSKLIGYDYGMHYKNIMIQGEEEFFEEYELYINGVKYHLAEKGVFQGGYFVTAVYEATW